MNIAFFFSSFFSLLSFSPSLSFFLYVLLFKDGLLDISRYLSFWGLLLGWRYDDLFFLFFCFFFFTLLFSLKRVYDDDDKPGGAGECKRSGWYSMSASVFSFFLFPFFVSCLAIVPLFLFLPFRCCFIY